MPKRAQVAASKDPVIVSVCIREQKKNHMRVHCAENERNHTAMQAEIIPEEPSQQGTPVRRLPRSQPANAVSLNKAIN